MSHMLVLGACWCRPMLGEESILEKRSRTTKKNKADCTNKESAPYFKEKQQA
jgi:hypothetical protein